MKKKRKDVMTLEVLLLLFSLVLYADVEVINKVPLAKDQSSPPNNTRSLGAPVLDAGSSFELQKLQPSKEPSRQSTSRKLPSGILYPLPRLG